MSKDIEERCNIMRKCPGLETVNEVNNVNIMKLELHWINYNSCIVSGDVKATRRHSCCITMESITLGKLPKSVDTDYQRCVICQKDKTLPLQKLTSLTSLKDAMAHRQDDIAKRLQKDFTPNILSEMTLWWHGQCRRWYTLKKSYECAARKLEVKLL